MNKQPKTPPHNRIPEIMDFHRAAFTAAAQDGYHAFADACERYLRMNRAGYDDLRQMATEYFTTSPLAYILECISDIEIEHDPLLKHGRALGAEIKPATARIDEPAESCPKTVKKAATVIIEQHTQSIGIACDVELARLAVGLKKSPQFRVWLVFLQHVRDNGGKDYITRPNLKAALRAQGVKFDDRTFNRWIHRGAGECWHILPGGRLRFIGYEALSTTLTKFAHESDLPGIPDLVATNRPGQKRSMYIPVSGKLADFEANVYASWVAVKENPTIRRETLMKLWNRDKSVLRDWERRAGVKPVHNYVFYTEAHYGAVPRVEDGSLRADVIPMIAKRNKEALKIYRAQMSNTYHAPRIKQHDKRGAGRRVSRVVTALLKSDNPAGICGHGEAEQSTLPGGLEPTGRQYFADHSRAKGNVKKTSNDHKPRYVPLYADDGNTFVWEYTPDGSRQFDKGELLTAAPIMERVYA